MNDLVSSQNSILFYSPVLKRTIVNRTFKRPATFYRTEKGRCPRCSESSIITIHNPKRKPFLDIERSICDSGHVEVSFTSRLNPEKTRSRL